MVGEWRRRRRRRVVIRNLAGLLVAGAVVAVVAIVAAAAVAQIGPTSGPYRRTVDRSYAALADPLVAQSDAAAVSFATLRAHGSRLARAALFDQLAQLDADTATVARQFDAISPPVPAGSAGTRCDSAMDGRARAVALARRALESVVGGPTGTGGGDEASAATGLESAATDLTAADASWSQCRRLLRQAPGSARLPASVWITDPAAWSAAAIDHFVTAVVASPTLAAVRGVAIVTAVTFPQSVPGTGGAGTVAPTDTLAVHVVVADTGNVDEDGVEVAATLAPAGAAPGRARSTVQLRAGSSVSTSLSSLAVQPGGSYTVTVTAIVPGARGPGSSATEAFPIAVSATAPGVPTALTVTAGPSRVVLDWTAPTSDGGEAVTGYQIFRGTSSGGESGTPIATGVTGTTYTDTDVTAGITYYYEVEALNGAGQSPPSDEAHSTAPRPGTTTTTR